MCGISAIFQTGGQAPVIGNIIEMTDIIRHRGPDGEGFVFLGQNEPLQAWCFGGAETPPPVYSAPYQYAPQKHFPGEAPTGAFASLGHRRLSIVDLTPSGHQPMCYGEGRYWITYNGEVYNHIELRRELEGLGHRFCSTSDTEVILAAYNQWGKECLSRFNGMFSFVLVDLTKGKVFAARDRFGIKPLYYWFSPKGFLAFASEIKQFTVLPGWDPSLNGQRVYDYLNWSLMDHTRETLFGEVFQLRGGEAVEAEFSKLGSPLPIYSWYRLNPAAFSGNLKEAAEEFQELLRDSIRLRLRADVAVGSCLSGGLDSSAIVCIANELLRQQGVNSLQKTFSAGSRVKKFDEGDYIKEVVKQTGVEAYYTYPTLEDLFEDLDALTWHQDEPLGSTSIFAQWCVFKLTSKNQVKVMLDGQGADEQLAGYHEFFPPRMAGLLLRFKWLSLWQELRAASDIHRSSPRHYLKQTASLLFPEGLRRTVQRLKGRGDPTSPDWLDMNKLGAAPEDTFFKSGNKAHSVGQLSYAQLTATSLPMLLHWEDRDSMAHSVESRVPFLDYRLVEFVLSLPDEYKIFQGTTKYVLRQSMKGVLPERIRLRQDKMAFVTPAEVWMKQQAPQWFISELKQAVEVSRGILTPRALDQLEQMLAGKIPFSYLTWRFISFGRWLKQFCISLP
ncbi:asparagine synthase (glutamine-hydrolyzing) [Candidatus Contubernalis alkaliaceticus]|uniref:asparagine synthase (glutamine-hydrolyzing) n=1 Tax=Candidatus Contubernalis alkaliaceticus TaxID=338645 RepID=UPI001F4C10AF|nr:asparagine synthase (glutamine-hydrolyzing) [Candidatus Contubernalis alkalaceticus]UNC93628.1 asparagine synthase (glutamine-hydrolyzing) [Candidatus Contubernalis alkalaceticus]